MKNIYIKAYMNLNLGDDLFVKMLLDKYPQTNFYICCDRTNLKGLLKYSNLYSPNQALLFVSRIIKRIIKSREAGIYRKYKNKCDAIVNIGGSIYMESLNWKSMLIDRKRDQKLFTIGANFGPYNNQSFKKKVEEEIVTSADTCFRDYYSYNEFKHLAQVRYAPDILFNYEFPNVACKSGSIGISVINPYKKGNLKEIGANYVNVMSQFCSIAISEGYSVTLFSFCVSEGDKEITDQILKRVKKSERIKSCIYTGDIDAFLSVFCSMEYIVAARFHAMIIGWATNKKVFPVVYNSKLANVISDLDFSGKSWNLLAKEDIKAFDMFNYLIRQPCLENIDNVRTESKKQFKVLDSFLLNRGLNNGF